MASGPTNPTSGNDHPASDGGTSTAPGGQAPAAGSRAAWEAAFAASPGADAPHTTMSGVPVEGVYGDGPYPGEFPYTRGIHASMYRSRSWTMRLFAGFGTAADTNARFGPGASLRRSHDEVRCRG